MFPTLSKKMEPAASSARVSIYVGSLRTCTQQVIRLLEQAVQEWESLRRNTSPRQAPVWHIESKNRVESVIAELQNIVDQQSELVIDKYWKLMDIIPYVCDDIGPEFLSEIGSMRLKTTYRPWNRVNFVDANETLAAFSFYYLDEEQDPAWP